jgi:hypothetical protein
VDSYGYLYVDHLEDWFNLFSEKKGLIKNEVFSLRKKEII